MKMVWAVVSFVVALSTASPLFASSRSGTVSFQITLNAPQDARDVKLWFPYPTSDANQSIENLSFKGNYTHFTLSREPASNALYLFTQWQGAPRDKQRQVTVSFHVKARERRVSKLVETKAPLPADAQQYIRSEFWIPSNDAKVVALSRRIVAGKKGILARSRAIYDWVVANTRRDPNIAGCGVGNVQATLAARSGKCADLSTLYVALARAAGVPAREVFGLRLGKPGQTDITDGHHCWAEFYLPGTGWVPVDPADVTKIMFQNNLDPRQAQKYADYYFGAVDEYRIVLHKGGRGIAFAEGNREKVTYFMYPYAEVDGKPLDYCKPKTFSFTVTFKEDQAAASDHLHNKEADHA